MEAGIIKASRWPRGSGASARRPPAQSLASRVSCRSSPLFSFQLPGIASSMSASLQAEREARHCSNDLGWAWRRGGRQRAGEKAWPLPHLLQMWLNRTVDR